MAVEIAPLEIEHRAVASFRELHLGRVNRMGADVE